MKFFCIGDPTANKVDCILTVSMYWTLVYIIIFYLSGSIYLYNNKNSLFYVKKITVVTTISGGLLDPSGGTTDLSGGSMDASGGSMDASGGSTTTKDKTNYIPLPQETVDNLMKIIGLFNIVLIATIILIIIWAYNQ
jgi:hypothetical protein